MIKNKKLIFLFFILALTLKPAYSITNDEAYYYNTAVSHYNKKQYDLAIQNFKKVTQLNPRFVSAYYNLGLMYYYKKQNNPAIENFKKVLNFNPNHIKAKKHLENIYYNMGYDYQNQEKFELSLKSYEKALKINPKNINALKNMAIIYENQRESLPLIETCKKITAISPNEAKAYFIMAYHYSLLGKHDLSVLNYKKVLSISPNYNVAKHNLEREYKIINENKMANKIDKTRPAQKAPQEIYNLINLENGVNPALYPNLVEIIDFIWGDREGRILLSIIKDNKIPITITLGHAETNARIQTKKYKQTFYLLGFIPIYSFNFGNKKSIFINIGEEHINAFRNTNLPSYQRIYAFSTIIHEFSHAAKNVIAKKSDNSILEEITASMVGYNITSRIFNYRDLTKEEAYKYSKHCLKAVLTDNHKFLPFYNDFIEEIEKIGVYPPYPELYQNIPGLYNSIKNDPDTIKFYKLEAASTY